MPNRLLTNDEVDALFAAHGLRPPEHAVGTGSIGVCLVPPVVPPTGAHAWHSHCWHRPRVWQGPVPVPRHCCWCGMHEGPAPGPHAEG